MSFCTAHSSRCAQVHLEHGARVDARVHDDASPLEGPDPQAEPHLPTLATVGHSVFNITVPRET